MVGDVLGPASTDGCTGADFDSLSQLHLWVAPCSQCFKCRKVTFPPLDSLEEAMETFSSLFFFPVLLSLLCLGV